MKVLFLYTELAGYVTACMNRAAQAGLEIHVVRLPIKDEAPFKFEYQKGLTFYDRHSLSDEQLVELAISLNPKAILCSGWLDKGYINVCKRLYKSTRTVLLLDNPWTGNFRQLVGVVWARFKLRTAFQSAWVPGRSQARFARRLGFSEGQIHRGFYCADLALFDKVAVERADLLEVPKNLIYIGRYLEFKGVKDLWDAFLAINPVMRTGWVLTCIGTGDLWPERPDDGAIKHLGFIQPEDLPVHLSQAGFFILPSHREPWGVVVHEMTACGLPLICSDAVGAIEVFAEQGKNAFIFASGRKFELRNVLTNAMQIDKLAYRAMCKASMEKSQQINQTQWVATLINLCN